MGCTSINKTTSEDNQSKTVLKFSAGINKGGITDNTDMTELSAVSQTGEVSVDAYSGATKTGINTSAHVAIPVFNNAVETGLDFMYSPQTFSYQDELNQFTGIREIYTSQLMVPVTYNLRILKSYQPQGLLRIKLGFLFQYNMLNAKDKGNQLPGFQVDNFSNGLTLGLESTPIHLDNGADLGFYMELYRGSQIYEDFYNRKSFEMPGSSFFKAGIIYKFNL
jgi:hypothetical protein